MFPLSTSTRTTRVTAYTCTATVTTGAERKRRTCRSPVPCSEILIGCCAVVIRVPVLTIVVQEAALCAHGGGRRRAGLAPQTTSLQRPRALVRALNFVLDGATNLEGANGRPNGALPAEDPVVERLARRRFQKTEEITKCDFRDQSHAGAGYFFVHEKAANAGRKEAQCVKLAQAVADLEADHPYDVASGLIAFVAGREERGAMHIRLEKGDQIRACLRDDEVVDVEKLGNPRQRRSVVFV